MATGRNCFLKSSHLAKLARLKKQADLIRFETENICDQIRRNAEDVQCETDRMLRGLLVDVSRPQADSEDRPSCGRARGRWHLHF
jgi:hypothetical protein